MTRGAAHIGQPPSSLAPSPYPRSGGSPGEDRLCRRTGERPPEESEHAIQGVAGLQRETGIGDRTDEGDGTAAAEGERRPCPLFEVGEVHPEFADLLARPTGPIPLGGCQQTRDLGRHMLEYIQSGASHDPDLGGTRFHGAA